MEDGSDDLLVQEKLSLYLSSDGGGDDSMNSSGDSNRGVGGSGGEVLSEDEFLGNDVLLAVSKFKDGQSVNSMKRNRRNFKILSNTDENNNNGSGSLQVPPQPTSPLSKSPTSSFLNSNSGGINNKSYITSPSSGNKVPLYQTSPYKSSALSPNTSNKGDDSSPQTLGKYQLLHHIGQGYFGNTYTGGPPDSSEYVSIKLIDKNRLSQLTLNVLTNDFEKLKSLKINGDGVVNHLGLVIENNGIGIVQEFIENGSLYDLYKRNGTFTESLLGKYIAQILETLVQLHQQNIIHRNLKASNILLAKGGRCKISDFSIGCSTPNPDPSLRYSLLAQPYWMAPEVLSMKSFNSIVDSWGIGVIILECLTGHPPYHLEQSDPMQALIEIIDLDKPLLDSKGSLLSTLSRDLRNFLQLCFNKNPMHRGSAQVLLKHPWLQSSQSPLTQNDLANTASNNLGSTTTISSNPNRRSDTPLNIDLLALYEQNEKEISEIQIPSSTSTKIDFMKFEFQHYIDSINGTNIITNGSLTDKDKIEKLKLIIDNNQNIGNNLKYQMQDSIQEQQKLIDLCENMKSKIQEILDHNKTGARMSARSNMLLKRTNQVASDYVRKNENLQVNIKRLEDYFISKDECAKKLATVVYRHKVSFESLINPTLAANVHYQIGSKVWKKGQEKKGLATLKDNFLFFFKNEKASVPLDVVYINDRKNISTQIIQDQKKKLYILTIGTTVFENFDENLIDLTDNIDNNINSNSNNSSNSSSNSNNNINENIDQNVNSNSNNKDNNVPSLPSFNSMSLIPTTTVWSILIFDNQKNMENWLGVLEGVIPWYDKKSSEISGKNIVFEKKHQKQKSVETTSNIGGSLITGTNSATNIKKGGSLVGDDLLGGMNWRKESGPGVVKFQGIFGLKIEDLMVREAQGAELPYFLTKMLKFLERYFQEEGLLRVSGSSVEILEIKNSLQKGEAIDYTVDRDPHAVTGVLKLFLRELPEPIISSDALRNQSIEIIQNPRLSDTDKLRDIQVYVLSQLPKSSYNLLKHIIYFAKRVIEHSDQNKMGLANVTTCFAPSLRIAPGLFSMLIQNYEQCFVKV